MKSRKPILHARDHLPGGADPLPTLKTSAAPLPDPVTDEGDKSGEDWGWWRFREFTGISSPQRTVLDEGGHGESPTGFDMVVNVYHVLDWEEEVSIGLPGPAADSRAMCRVDAGSFGAVNWWNSATGFPCQWGAGGNWSVVGWFKFSELGNCDVLNWAGGDSARTTLLLNPNGSVSLYRQGTTFTSAAGLIGAGAWVYIAVVCGGGRIRVYVNPGAPEAGEYAPTIGNDYPFNGPMAMETWGLENGNYTAAELADRLKTNGFASVAVQLNAEPAPGRDHADYIAKLAADVATLQAAGIQVIGWGEVDSNTGADLAATGVTGWMPQIEGPSQYDNVIAALGAGVGAGMPKAVVTTYGGLDTPAKVAALAAAGIDSAAVEVYADIGDYPYSDVDAMLGAGVSYGFDADKLVPMIGTYRGETQDDYTGFDADVIPNYGIYNVPQTSDASWAAFRELNQGTVMLTGAVIDEPDPATSTNTYVFSVGGSNDFPTFYGSDGCFQGCVSEVYAYKHAITGDTARDQYLAGEYGDEGTVPIIEDVPSGSIPPTKVAPGGEGQTMVTREGKAIWTDPVLDDATDVDVAEVSDGDVLVYDASVSAWVAGAGAGFDLVYRGEWEPDTEYVDGEIVVYEDSLYLCVRPSTGPPSGWDV